MPAEQNGMKICCCCKQRKSIGEFGKSKDRKDGLTYECKLCRRKRSLKYARSEHGRKLKQKWAKSHRRERKAIELKHNYNLTLAEFDEMYIAQQGCCAICGQHQSELKRVLQVDHNHKTGEVRALLCSRCNTAIGLLRENINLLERAKQYLQGF